MFRLSSKSQSELLFIGSFFTLMLKSSTHTVFASSASLLLYCSLFARSSMIGMEAAGDAPPFEIEEHPNANDGAPDVIAAIPGDIAEAVADEPIDVDAGEIGEEGEFEEMEVDEYMDAASLPRLDSVLDPAGLPIPGQIDHAPSGNDLLPEPVEPVVVVVAAAAPVPASPEPLPAAEPPQAISIGDNPVNSPESEGQISSDIEEDVQPAQPIAAAVAEATDKNVVVSGEKLDDDLENLEDRLYIARMNVENLLEQVHSINDQVANSPDMLDMDQLKYVYEQIGTCLEDLAEIDQGFEQLHPGIRANAIGAIEVIESEFQSQGVHAVARNFQRLRQMRADMDEWFDLPSVQQLKPLYKEPRGLANEELDYEVNDTIDPTAVVYDRLVDPNQPESEGWGYTYQPEIPALELASFAVPATIIPALPSSSGTSTIIPLMDVRSGLSVNDFPSLTDVTAAPLAPPQPYHPPLPSRSNQSVHAVKSSTSTTAAIPSLLDIEVSFPLEILKRSSSQIYAPRGKMGAFAKEFLDDDDAKPSESSPTPTYHRTPIAISESGSNIIIQQDPQEEGETTSRPSSSAKSHHT
uniref:GAT domain-containing protein n=1 Tax=Panagrellus redivivus TaxID=6233 RepID=A0A7E5A0A7_PANRE